MMNRYRVVIVDDETLARQRLRQLLSVAPDFDVVGECGDGRALPDAVRELRPDVLFLDVRMPFIDGFEARALVAEHVRAIVFVTAHAEHAARAFDVAASDYLLKPVTQARFNEALQRLRRSLGKQHDPQVLLGGRDGGVAVKVADITRIEADGAYVVVFAGGRRHVLRESLAQMTERLGREHFVRVHRSAAVNLAHVRGVKRGVGATRQLAIELTDGARLPISRRKAAAVIAKLRRDAGGETS